MLTCCNRHFKANFSYILNNSKYFYRAIEFAYCPNCHTAKFKDYVQFEDGSDFAKELSGKKAILTYEKWLKKINSQKYCSFANQNVYYGDFKKTNRKDLNGLPIYIQLRKNFNNQSEILNVVETRVYKNGTNQQFNSLSFSYC